MYHHETRGANVFTHGDDFVVSAAAETAMWFRGKLRGRFEVKESFTGNPQVRKDFDINTEGQIHDRVVRCTEQGFEYEADTGHVDPRWPSWDYKRKRSGEMNKTWAGDETETLNKS